jgi:hypothetical protein
MISRKVRLWANANKRPKKSAYFVTKNDSIMVNPLYMSPMLVVKRKMNTIKQLSKGDNVRQKPFDVT